LRVGHRGTTACARTSALRLRLDRHAVHGVPAHHSQGPPFPGTGIGVRVRVKVRVRVRVRRTLGMADPGNGGPEPCMVLASRL